jgi:hypothetical protein
VGSVLFLRRTLSGSLNMKSRGHYQRSWEATLHRAMQTAIAVELRERHKPPRELTRELAVVLTELDDTKEWTAALVTGLKPKVD